MDKKLTELTRGEEEIMRYSGGWAMWWSTKSSPRQKNPPEIHHGRNLLKILENKGFVNHTPEGKSHRYYPAVSREEYARGVMSSVLSSYFDGSLAQMVSFFSRHEDISVTEMEEILQIMQNARK
ncbi:MAG: BlaI/MecI/CopY family transcriptional regulator [Alistipes onderdonkii]